MAALPFAGAGAPTLASRGAAQAILPWRVRMFRAATLHMGVSGTYKRPCGPRKGRHGTVRTTADAGRQSAFEVAGSGSLVVRDARGSALPASTYRRIGVPGGLKSEGPPPTM